MSSSQDSLFHRIRDNFRQLFAPVRIFPSSANGAPLHLPVGEDAMGWLREQADQAHAELDRAERFLR